MPAAEPNPTTTRERPLKLGLMLLGALAAGVAVVVIIMYAFALIDTGNPKPFATGATDVRWELAARIAVPGAGLAVGLVAAVFAYVSHEARLRELDQRDQQTIQSAHQATQAHELSENSSLRDRFTAAAEQLGSASPVLRLAGVYAVAALADEWHDRGNRREMRVCIDLLCGYLRTPRTDETILAGSTSSAWKSESRVRETIAITISDRMQAHASTDTDGHPSHEPHAQSWIGHHFNLQGSVIDYKLAFTGVDFSRTTIDLSSTYVKSGTVSFQNCKALGGRIRLLDIQVIDGSIELGNIYGNSIEIDISRAHMLNSKVYLELFNVSGLNIRLTGSRIESSSLIIEEIKGREIRFDAAHASIENSDVKIDSAALESPHIDAFLLRVAGGRFYARGIKLAGGRLSAVHASTDGISPTFEFCSVFDTKVSADPGNLFVSQSVFLESTRSDRT